MSILKPQKIEDYILSRLAQGACPATELVSTIQSLRANTTKQAVYSALRQMKSREEVVIYRGTVALNLTWLHQLARFVDSAKQALVGGELVGDILTRLSPGDRITYHFYDPMKTDVFWTHALYLLTLNDPTGEPVYLYNPHEWFLLVRNENETEAIRTITASGKQFFLLAGHDHPLDRWVQKYFDGERSQYHALPKPHFTNNNYYLNVIGNTLIEVWLDKSVADALDNFYQRAVTWNAQTEEDLFEILQQKRKVRIAISHNRTKAERFKKFCRKFFYISKEPSKK